MTRPPEAVGPTMEQPQLKQLRQQFSSTRSDSCAAQAKTYAQDLG